MAKSADNCTEDQEIEAMVVPKSLYINRVYNGKTWLAGVGPRDAKIMFVTPVVSEEEAAEEIHIGYDKTIARVPKITDCGQWHILSDLALRNGLDIAKCFVTSIVKFLPEKRAHRNKPPMQLIQKVLPCLEHEIETIKPDIIVCVGKLAWDVLSGEKAKESDIYGLWLYSKKYNCKLYAIPHLSKTLKPEMHERFKMDLLAIKQMHDSMASSTVAQDDFTCTIVNNAHELRELVSKLESANAKFLSVDCEWGGQVHVDGKLRSLQIAWSNTEATYIRFRNEEAEYVFDVDYKEAGAILGRWLNNPDVKYIGHHVSADLSWMHYWLGLDWFNKAIFDTEFALQCCDESLDLGLDVLALRYTNFGKYDWDLIQYRKKNPERRGEGYELIPDEILIPYGAKDVLTVYRAWPVISGWLEKQNLTKYYNEILNPFVTDVFTFFCLKGLPIDRAKIDDMREFYHWVREEATKDLLVAITNEAGDLLYNKLKEVAPDSADELYANVELMRLTGKSADAVNLLKAELSAKQFSSIIHHVDHWVLAPEFNHQSTPQLQRWLFKVKNYEPIKSTANKEAGMPSVSWDKILTYPPDKQATFTPAADKGTLEILASRNSDKVLDQMLAVKAVCNICKAFLRKAEVDEDGNIVSEKGLHYWITSKDTICLNHSCTETGRSRAWNPNILNWPSYINKRLSEGICGVLSTRKEQGLIPDNLSHYAELKPKQLPTVRSIVMARPGWCIVESDYQTAEMRGLAFIAGDKDLTRLILEPDQCFAKVKPECIPAGIDAEDCVVRLKFPPYITKPEDKDKYIMTYASGGEIKATFTEDQLLRNSDGTIASPRFDMHWGVAEMGYGKCREVMDKKKDRGSAKVINFCLAKNTLVLTDIGYIPIQHVDTSMRLWNGLMWCKHGGAVCRGKKPVIRRGNLVCTPDHKVYYRDPSPENNHVIRCTAAVCVPKECMVRLNAYKTSDNKVHAECLTTVPRHDEYTHNSPRCNAIQKYWTSLEDLDYVPAENIKALRDRHIPVKELEEGQTWMQEVWDIVDVQYGNMFVANGYLVHNSSSYGGQPASLARQVEIQTGVHIPIDEAKTLLDAVGKRQPKAEEFFKQMEEIPRTVGIVRAASGRLRHCHTFSKDVEGISTRTKEGWLAALGRECRNYLLQESVGASAARACYWMVEFSIEGAKKYGLRGYPCVCLYDSIVVHCPEEERYLWAKALELFMYKKNGWVYGEDNRILRYAIDTELNAGWSTAPYGQQKENLHNEEYAPLPERLKPLLQQLEAEIELYTNMPELSVYNHWDFK